jgi:uncharacterized membrane protein YtjA (UPF0391 family)
MVLLLAVPQETGSGSAGMVISAAFNLVSGKEYAMLHYAVVFFVIALVAALFGFGGIAAGAAEIAKILFFIFLVLFVVSLIVGMLRK